MKAKVRRVRKGYAIILPDGIFLKMCNSMTAAIIYCLERGIAVEVEQ